MTKRTATIRCHQNLHLRPAVALMDLRKLFPDTQVVLKRPTDRSGGGARLDSILGFVNAAFEDGESVVVEATGRSEELVAEIFRVALESLHDPAQAAVETSNVDYARVKHHMFDCIDAAIYNMPEELAAALTRDRKAHRRDAGQERALFHLNDRLHNLTVPLLPAIARYFSARVELRFETQTGVHVCAVGTEFDDAAIDEILEAAPPAGTRITMVVTGARRKEASQAVQQILTNLRECDAWLRRRGARFDREDMVPGLLSYAQSMMRLRGASKNGASADEPELGRVLTEDRVAIYLPSSELSKEEVIHQLVALQSVHFSALVETEVLDSVWEAERRMPVFLREGVAVAHASLAHGPRISLSAAVVPKGVRWSAEQPSAKVIFLFLCAHDTQTTYMEHLAQLAVLYKADPQLQDLLVGAKSGRELISALRHAEDALRDRMGAGA